MQKLGVKVLATVSGGGGRGDQGSVAVSADGGVAISGNSRVVQYGNTYTGDSTSHASSGRSAKKS